MEPQAPPTKVITTNEMIDALARAGACGNSPLHQHVFHEALHALVRLAKAEKLLEIKRDVARAVGLRLPPQSLPPPH